MTLLCLYGLNSLLLTWIYLRRRDDPVPEPPAPEEWPWVTVQLPIYNELHTVERLLTAVAGWRTALGEMPQSLFDQAEVEIRLVVEPTFISECSLAQIVAGGGIEINQDPASANLFDLLLMLGIERFTARPYEHFVSARALGSQYLHEVFETLNGDRRHVERTSQFAAFANFTQAAFVASRNGTVLTIEVLGAVGE